MDKKLLFCFDFDDTLIATFPHVCNVIYPKLAEILGVPSPSQQTIKEYWGAELTNSLPSIFNTDKDIETLIYLLSELHQQYPPPSFPHARQILEILKRHGRHIALFTNNISSIVKKTLKVSLNMDESDFHAICYLTEQPFVKEAPETLSYILSQLNVNNHKDLTHDQVLIVGDSIRDMHMAQQGNSDFRALTTGITSHKEFLVAGQNKSDIFGSLEEALRANEEHGVVVLIKNSEGKLLMIKEGRKENKYFGRWSGPHGRCNASDVLEEETVVRETLEECGLNVRPIKKLYTRSADTKVKTVSFWSAEMIDTSQQPQITCEREVADIGWFSMDELIDPDFPLYPGTRDFFSTNKFIGGL